MGVWAESSIDYPLPWVRFSIIFVNSYSAIAKSILVIFLIFHILPMRKSTFKTTLKTKRTHCWMISYKIDPISKNKLFKDDELEIDEITEIFSCRLCISWDRIDLTRYNLIMYDGNQYKAEIIVVFFTTSILFQKKRNVVNYSALIWLPPY